MTTFVTVLRRAVENLDDNSEQERAAIYDKARAALQAQLQQTDPPLPPEEVERQCAELDEAIDRIEADYAGATGSPALPDLDEEPSPGPANDADPVSDPHERFRSAVDETAGLGAAAAQAAQSARAAYGAFGPESGSGYGRDGYEAYEADAVPYASHRAEAADEVAAALAEAEDPEAGDQTNYDGLPPEAFDEDDDGGGRGVSIAMWAIVFLMIAGIGGAAFWQRDALTEVVMSLGEGETEIAQMAEEPKIDERVPRATADEEEGVGAGAPADAAPADAAPAETAPSPEASLPQDAARVAQALLVEEGADESLNSLGGTVDWALLDDPEAPPEAAKVIRATVQVPDKNMSLTMAIRRNTDPDLPASHTVELLFDLPQDFENGGIAGVAGLVMKATPQSSGQPLIGAVVPVTDEFYLLGLSESEFDRARNIDELRRRSFIDIPIAYADETRAILSIAKGESGAEVFERAFEAWGHRTRARAEGGAER